MKINQPKTTPDFFKSAALAVIACVAGSGPAQAAITVDYTAAIGQRDVIMSDGSPAPDGGEVRIGFFAPGFNVTGNASDLPALQAAWTQFDSVPISTLIGQPGRFTGSASLTNPAFDNQQIHLWILQTSDSLPVNNLDYGNVTEHGIFTNGAASNWHFPVEGSVIPSTLVNSSEVSTADFGTIVPGGPGSLQLSVIPEPSSAILLASTLAALALVRRKH